EVALPERGLGEIGVVEGADEILHTAVLRVLEQVPVDASVVLPLVVLPDLPTHEEQLASGMRPHPAEQRTQVGELLPAVTWHLREQRALSVRHLVVAERKDEVLVERVQQREGQLVVMP